MKYTYINISNLFRIKNIVAVATSDNDRTKPRSVPFMVFYMLNTDPGLFSFTDTDPDGHILEDEFCTRF